VDCEEFRRKLLEDPKRREVEFLAHRAECADCDREAGVVERIEAELEKVLRVAPPPDIGERLKPPPRRPGQAFALAASLAGALAVGLWVWMAPLQNGGGVVAEVLDHIGHEPRALVSRAVLPPEEWRRLSPGVSVDTSNWEYAVTYAAPCDIMRAPGLHLVLAGEKGPVTVLVISGERVAHPRLVSDGVVRGVVRPLARGSLAVVGDSSVPVEKLAEELAPLIRVRA
jgi:hypothetical protein